MFKFGIITILVGIASIYQAYSIKLLANYKLWKSVSPELVYDFSDNSRHGKLSSGFTVTDRGLSTSNQYTIRLMTYGFLSLDEYAISVWLLNSGDFSQMSIYLYTELKECIISYDFKTSTILKFYFDGIELTDKTTTANDKIKGWNLHTVRIVKRGFNSSILDINLYLNLNSLHSTFIDSTINNFSIQNISFVAYAYLESSNIIGNEIWVYNEFSNITDMNYLILPSSSCGCEFKCPTAPGQSCLSTVSESYNKLGNQCDTSCIIKKQSCESVNTNCIINSKDGCPYGLYDREALECIFYCPSNSCTCPTITIPTINTLLSCSCISGYKKISETPQACISDRCLEYHRVGYKYVCDTTESGYSLYNTGECCECASGFTQLQSYPIICVNTSICIGHSISGGDYTCASCAEGYTKDNKGKCDLCSPGYSSVSANPYTCITRIDNCSDYNYIGNSWKCKTCREGYVVDSEGECNLCSSGYEAILSNPLVCIINIERCAEYINVGETRICSRCSEGYSLDYSGRCNTCNENYVNVLDDPFTCALKIDHCNQYDYSNGYLRCKECEVGYKEGISTFCDECEDGYVKIEPNCILEIPHCIKYENSSCLACEEGYFINSNYICEDCNSGYNPKCYQISNCIAFEYSDEGLKCKECESEYVAVLGSCYPKINFCSSYTNSKKHIYCSECTEGIIFDCDSSCNNSGKCICKYGSNISSDEDCKICPSHCKTCDIVSNNIECIDCKAGYNLIGSNCIISKTDQISESTELLLGEVTKATKWGVIASVAVSMASLNINRVLSIIGIIQILNYILLYNIDIPSRARVILEGISLFNILPNIFEYFIPNNNTLDIERYSRVDINNELLLINLGEMLTFLIIIAVLILILRGLNSLSGNLQDSNMIKKMIRKLLDTLEWNLVIGYLIQGSLELTIFSLINICHVSLSNTHSIIGLILSIIVIVRNILDPFNYMPYIITIYSDKKL